MQQTNIQSGLGRKLTRWGAVAALGLFLASCAALTGDSGNVDANTILLNKAEDRLSVAQESVKEATDLIAEGEQNKRDGQMMIEQGQNKIDTGARAIDGNDRRLPSTLNLRHEPASPYGRG